MKIREKIRVRVAGSRASGTAGPGTRRRRVMGAVAAAVAVLVLLAAFPDALHACPVCFDRDDEARIAFLATTGLLTLLPLGLVFGTGAWLRKRAREVEAEARRGEGRVAATDTLPDSAHDIEALTRSDLRARDDDQAW